jgi:protocatechuate 3,4-dioxygenase beta subunit
VTAADSDWSPDEHVAHAPVLLLLSTAAAQAPTYPLGRATGPEVVELEVVDRYALPVPEADVRVTWSRYDAQFGLAEELRLGVGHSEGLRTDAEGRVTFAVPRGEPALATVTRSGYARLESYWLFAGWRYRAVLEIGATGSIVCVDAAGEPVSGVRLQVLQSESAGGPARLHGDAPTWTDSRGRAVLNFLSNGSYVARARGPDGRIGQIEFEVASQFGHEGAAALRDARLTLAAPLAREIVVEDRYGDPIEGLAATARTSRPDTGDGVSLQQDGRRVTIRNVRPGGHQTIALCAPGYEPVTLDVASPTEATATIVLAPAARDAFELEIPADERDGEVLVPSSMEEPSPWVRVPLDEHGRALVRDVPRGTTYFGLLVRDGRPRAFLCASESGTRAALARPASLDLAYRVDGHVPVSALVRIHSRSSAAGRPVPNLAQFGRRIAASDPEGVVRARDLLPGEYHVEPHFHGTVFQDSLREVTLAGGEALHLDVEVRRGRVLRGRVVERESRAPVRFGFVT